MEAKKIDSYCRRRPYADTESYDVYESDCETIGQFVDLLKLNYPNKDHAWYEAYIDNITKDGNKFTVRTIIPFTD